MSRVLEKVVTVPFQCDPNREPEQGDRYATICDDGRLELRSGDGRIWRCHLVKLFAGLETAKETGVVYVEATIPLKANVLWNTPPGVPDENIRRVEDAE